MMQSLRLQHFRSYTDESFEFDPGVNIVVGANASGKTNLLEAILVLAHGGSYRAHDGELIQFGAPWARLDASVDNIQRTVKLLTEPKPEKLYEIEGRTFRRLTLQHELPVVLFEPNHLVLLTGPPEKRREYLDELLSQMIPGYGTTMRAYRRVLAQRNRLLKSGRPADDQLFPWNVRLSELGGRIVRQRTQLIEAMNTKIGELYRDLSQSTASVAIAYCAGAPADQYETSMLQQLEARLHSDVERGFTTFGPHREDFAVLFDGHPVEDVASRGETRTFILGMKIIEMQLIEERREEVPLVLLDDVFSELDGKRRHYLTDYLGQRQVFITTTDADVVVRNFAACHIIPMT